MYLQKMFYSSQKVLLVRTSGTRIVGSIPHFKFLDLLHIYKALRAYYTAHQHKCCDVANDITHVKLLGFFNKLKEYPKNGLQPQLIR